MKTKAGHLTYCTNIHTGENWKDHFRELQQYIPKVKESIAPDDKMGVGLRVSRQMQLDLGDISTLKRFQSWLQENDLYVFTLNGFPYGNFHSDIIKEKVHAPDWTTPERYEYTLRLFDLLRILLPGHLQDGGISTSPLGYRHQYPEGASRQKAIEQATQQIIAVAEYLDQIYHSSGQLLHLDLEPEPDGIIEDGKEFIDWYNGILLPEAEKYFSKSSKTKDEAARIIRRHICLCYDVCHMAVEFENQPNLIDELKKHQIRIGKIQLSSAIKIPSGASPEALRPFVEDQYLHQAVLRRTTGELRKYKDLDEALAQPWPDQTEWRVHYHVPIFTERYGHLDSTRSFIDEILDIHTDSPLSNHLEIETYTWEVLPEDLQLPLEESIIREYQYILNKIND